MAPGVKCIDIPNTRKQGAGMSEKRFKSRHQATGICKPATFRLPLRTLGQIDNIARAADVSKAYVVREAVEGLADRCEGVGIGKSENGVNRGGFLAGKGVENNMGPPESLPPED